MDKDLMAQYGQACVNLEIAQNQHMELKKKVAEMLNRQQVQEPSLKDPPKPPVKAEKK